MLTDGIAGGGMLRAQMGLWGRSQQWVYSRPRVAAAAAFVLLLLVGAGGWETARVASPGTTQAAVKTVYGVAGAHMIQVEADVGPVTRVVTRVVRRTRTITTPRLTKTVVERRIATRTVRGTHTIREIVTVAAPDTRRTRTARGPVGGTRSTTRVVTITEVRTETETVTQPPVTMTVTVTTTRGKGH